MQEDEELLDVMKESERRALQREADRNALDASRLERERAKQELKRQKKDAKKLANEIERKELEEAAALHLAQATAVADEMQKERDRLLAQELEDRAKAEGTHTAANQPTHPIFNHKNNVLKQKENKLARSTHHI